MKKSILQKPIKQVLISKGFEHVVEFFYKIKNQQIILSTEKNKPPIIRRLPQGKATPHRVPPL